MLKHPFSLYTLSLSFVPLFKIIHFSGDLDEIQFPKYQQENYKPKSIN